MDEGFFWEKRKEGACITGWNGDTEEIRLPEMTGGLPVTEIGPEAFAYSSFKSIRLPSGLKKIGEKAFAFCFDLTEITLPESLEEFDASSLLCTGIKTLYLPDQLTTIHSPQSLDMYLETAPAHPFYYADGTSLYRRLEDGCLQLLSVHTEEESLLQIREGTVDIAPTAFQNIHNSLSLKLPASLESIDGRALYSFYAKSADNRLTGLSVAPDNPCFFSDEKGLWKNVPEGYALVRWTGPTSVNLSDEIRTLLPYCLADLSLEHLRLPCSCEIKPQAFRGTTVRFLEAEDCFLLPEGAVENNSLLAALTSSGHFDPAPYDEMLINGYLTVERIRMGIRRLLHADLPVARKEKLSGRLLKDGAQIAELLLKEQDTETFHDWLALPGQNRYFLSEAMDALLSLKQSCPAAAGQMLSDLLKKRGSFTDTDTFDL